MRFRLPCLLLLILAPRVLPAQENPAWTIGIEEVRVSGRAQLTEIGTQHTVLDSMATRDNITQSMADVLSLSSTIFIKSYGRATLSTASFRGTAPSHTQVTWNGMKLNSPMLGMVDFSLIPSYFIDDVTLYHGASSVGVAGGGLGGAITLGNHTPAEEGFGLRYIQGFGSYGTYDQFLKFTYGGKKFGATTRAFYALSDNDFRYTNYRKKIYTYNDDHEIIGSYYPKERNKNGSFKDLHIQQELYYRTDGGDNLTFSGWYMDSRRGVPMLSVNYRDEDNSRNRQHERTVRVAAGWDRVRESFKLEARAGYTYTDLQYLYLGDSGRERLDTIIHSRSYVHTAFGKFTGDYYIGDKWLFSGNVSLHQHFVKSADRAIVSQDGSSTVIGYDQARAEVSAFGSVRWRPTARLGLAVNLREELYRSTWSPIIPAGFVEYTLSKKGNVVLKASVARNYRYPTLNDLYFMPGGNPELRPEKGFTYDAGMEFGIRRRRMQISGEATFYDSRIRDWILWMPTFKGFWSPLNVRKVHSYGIELKGKLNADLGSAWWLYLDGNFTVSHAKNHGDPVSWGDNSGGKQLVYIPKYSGAVVGKLGWKKWIFTYKFSHYSRRFTTTDNDLDSKLGVLGAYYMSDVSLEKSLSLRWASINLKLAVNNLFNEEYESVLSRPMAGRNYGFFIEFAPVFKKKR